MKQTMELEIIAEAGSNHNGDVGKAIELVNIAKESGAHSIKYQIIFADGLYVPKFHKSRKEGDFVNNDVFNVRAKEELSRKQWERIWTHANDVGIDISASVFCEKGVELLKSLGAEWVKIASTDLTNKMLLKIVMQHFNRIILSTGMAQGSEVTKTLEFVDSVNYDGTLELMHCVSLYPCSLEKSNITRVNFLRTLSNRKIGYSDHTEGIESSLMALAFGVSTFEKHFTLDKKLPGFDHKHACDPEGLKKYIDTLNKAFISLNVTPSHISAEEAVTKVRARRGVYAARNLPVGHIIKEGDLLYVRPSSSGEETSVEDFAGQRVTENIPKYAAINRIHGVGVVESNWRAASKYWTDEMAKKNMKNIAKTKDRLQK